jgi:hypothetical protein
MPMLENPRPSFNILVKMAATMEGEVGKMRLLNECARDRREELMGFCTVQLSLPTQSKSWQ